MQEHLDVQLIAYTKLNEAVLPNLSLQSTDQGATLSAIAASQCYNAGHYNLKEADFSVDKVLTKRVAASGHTSILEHASASFLITGVSRALSHQLVRHRIASYTQQSQRYTDQSSFGYIVPVTIKSVPKAFKYYVTVMDNLQRSYVELLDIMCKNGYKKEEIQQDVRYILPNACSTQIVMTMNYRELGDFLGKRMCTRAQREIRIMAGRMMSLLHDIEPEIFGHTGIFKGAKCYNQGYCDEGKSCGLTPRLQDLYK